MDLFSEYGLMQTRRYFFGRMAAGLGTAALSTLLSDRLLASAAPAAPAAGGALPRVPWHHAPRARNAISLFMSGAPSQMDMYDYKPVMNDWYDKDLPETIRKGQRLTTMTSGQKRFPIAPTKYKFEQCGKSGMWVSQLLPYMKKIVDDATFIRSMYTEAINHDPAITFIQSGSQLPGRPSLGSWLSYGLGCDTSNLPSFVVMTPSWSGRKDAQALYTRLWGAGFLPSQYQGVALRAAGDPVLYLSNPDGVSDQSRRAMLDSLAKLNHQQHQAFGDPETLDRIAQYEMAFRMQTSVPELTDISREPKSVLDLYGPEVHKPGTFARSCLLARRLIERGVRFVQLFHRGWDQHGNIAGDLPNQCRDIDQPSFGLVTDLKQRGMLDETLVTWGGEFGRTVYCQGGLSRDNYGRDHHPRCFTTWAAGGGIKAGYVHGETDDFSYNIVDKPVHIHDMNATMLHLLGIDHERLTYRFQGRDFRLTDIHGELVRDIMA